MEERADTLRMLRADVDFDETETSLKVVPEALHNAGPARWMAQGLGGLGFRVWGLEFGVWGLGLGVLEGLAGASGTPKPLALRKRTYQTPTGAPKSRPWRVWGFIYPHLNFKQ